MVAVPDYATDDTDFTSPTAPQAIVEVRSDSVGCTASQFQVVTGEREETVAAGNITAVDNALNNEPFIFMVA